MSGGRRKRNSKWDLNEESSHEKVWDPPRSGKVGISSSERESLSRRFSPRAAGYNNAQKWSLRDSDDIQSSRHELQFSCRESIPGSRGSHKDDRIDDHREKFRATTSWDGDENYDMKMSPGLEDWRQQIRRRSPRNNWNGRRRSRSRSRSRSGSWNQSKSPVHELRRDTGVFDRKRGRPGESAQLCNDFAAGRCWRGSHCQFSHHSGQTYEDSWDSSHKQAGAPKYSTPHDSREYPTRSGRNRQCSLERGGEHESHKSGDLPCKFFVAGNCRNGKYCRFSHSAQGLVSPKRRSWNDSLVRGDNSDVMEKLWSGPKWSDTATFSDVAKLNEGKNEKIVKNRKSRDDRLLRNQNSDDVKRLWDGPTMNDTEISADASKFCKNQNVRIGSPGPRFAAWSKDNRFPSTLDENMAHANITEVTHGGDDNSNIEARQSSMEKAGADVDAPESGGTENWLGDMEMSPEWNYPVKPSCHTMNEGNGHITRNSGSKPLSDTSLLREQGIVREASGLLRDATTNVDKSYLKRGFNKMDKTVGKMAIPHIDLNFSASILPTQTFDQNVQSSSALPFSSLNSVGHSQGAMTSEGSILGNIINPQNLTVIQVDKSVNKQGAGEVSASQFGSAIQPAPNMVSSEQLTQLTNISASLVDFLGIGQQLPQLYAACNSDIVMVGPSSANSERLIAQDSAMTSQPIDGIRSQSQYDPLSDSIEPQKHDIVNSSGLSVNPADRKPCDSLQNCKLSEVTVAIEAEGDKKAQVDVKNPQENGEVQKTGGDDKDDKADESKKSKDTKGIRAFKFTLAEFVKELLKPTWKEGQINKDIYKNVVKKVVDKVIGSMQGGASIPQTQGKIDQYLSFSKIKLTKLVQAYVEKLRKC